MYAKIQITGIIEVKTGMHIGGSSAFSAIGAVDSTVIKDIRTGLPMLPGSSLKGKMRALLAKKYNTEVAAQPDDDDERLTRLFGSAKKSPAKKNDGGDGPSTENSDDSAKKVSVKRSRVLISDMFLCSDNEKELRDLGLQAMTEIKAENSINRATGVATPRQIERAVRGSQFEIDIMYEVGEVGEIKEDMEILAEGFQLLQYDYLGGSGSRGYGKVTFPKLEAKLVVGEETDNNVLKECNEILQKVIPRKE